MKVLLAGETWTTTTLVTKGYDTFTTGGYGQGYSYLRDALVGGGVEVDVIPGELVATDFPDTMEKLDEYDAIIISDVGSRTFTLTKKLMGGGGPQVDRLALLRDWVARGGGLVMAGGYLTFQGIEAKGMWARTPLADALPVEISVFDDRSERPAGVVPQSIAEHEILADVPSEWPAVLGWNTVAARESGTVLATVEEDPLLVLGEYGEGRSVAFTSDISPHWAPKEFMDWEGYPRLWLNIIRWVAG